MSNPAPGFEKHPGYQVSITPSAKELVVRWREIEIARSQRALQVEETKHRPVWYLPVEDISAEHLQATDTDTYCPFKGHATYWSLVDGATVEPDAVWAYLAPYDECTQLAGYASFYTNKVDLYVDGDLDNKDGPGWV